MIASLCLGASLAVTGQEPPPVPEPPPREAPVALKGADLSLLREVRRVAKRVEALRGQEFARAPLAIRAPAEARRMAAEIRVARGLPGDRLEARGRAWDDLGLDPDGPARLYRARAADIEGFAIDPMQGRLLVDPTRLTEHDFEVEAGVEGSMTLLEATGVRPDEPLLVHALVHQLHDPHVSAGLPEATDIMLARAVWEEGEANLLSLAYLFGAMDLQDEVIAGRIDPANVLNGALVPREAVAGSDLVAAVLDWVYRDGFALFTERFRTGGWSAVEIDSTRRDTTAELLHPDREPWPVVSIAQRRPEQARSMQLADRDQVGERLILALIARWTGKDNLALQAADGWRGDALYRWETPGKASIGLTQWLTRWTDEASASDFDYAVRRMLQARYPNASVSPHEASPWVLDGSDRKYRVHREGTEVEIIVRPIDFENETGT